MLQGLTAAESLVEQVLKFHYALGAFARRKGGNDTQTESLWRGVHGNAERCGSGTARRRRSAWTATGIAPLPAAAKLGKSLSITKVCMVNHSDKTEPSPGQPSTKPIT